MKKLYPFSFSSKFFGNYAHRTGGINDYRCPCSPQPVSSSEARSIWPGPSTARPGPNCARAGPARSPCPGLGRHPSPWAGTARHGVSRPARYWPANSNGQDSPAQQRPLPLPFSRRAAPPPLPSLVQRRSARAPASRSPPFSRSAPAPVPAPASRPETATASPREGETPSKTAIPPRHGATSSSPVRPVGRRSSAPPPGRRLVVSAPPAAASSSTPPPCSAPQP